MGSERRVAAFEFVSKDEFIRDGQGLLKGDPASVYEELKLPARATAGSAGYDFYLPEDIELKPGETITIPTGIRVRMDRDYVLLLMPRSSLGFRYRMQLNNTVGVIDSDYYHADNEGHIFARITNDSNQGRIMSLPKGTAFLQGIFMPYGITMDDDVTEDRTGGIGSTDRK
jgi:dUTP pyrophosphatase